MSISKNKFKNNKKSRNKKNSNKNGGSNINLEITNNNYLKYIIRDIKKNRINYDLLSELLNQNNINNKYKGKSLLYVAIEYQNIKLIELLIDKGIDVNIHNINSGLLPINLAIDKENYNILNLLINNGADINKKNGNGELLLNYIIQIFYYSDNKSPYYNFIELILDNKNFNPDIKDILGFTPLHYACYYSIKFIVEKLINLNANPNLFNNNGILPIHYTINDYKIEIFNILVENSAILNVLDNNGYNLIHYCAINNAKKILQKLMLKNIDINHVDNFGNSPLFISYNRHYLDIFDLLLNENNVNHTNSEGNSLLHLAIINKDIKTIDKLFKLGIDTSILNNDGLEACQLIPEPDNFNLTINFPIMHTLCGKGH